MSKDSDIQDHGRKAVDMFLGAVTYPVTWTDDIRLVTLGSGALFQHGERHFLLTARHLFDKYNKKTDTRFPYEGLVGPTSLRNVTPRKLGEKFVHTTSGSRAISRDVIAIELLDDAFVNAFYEIGIRHVLQKPIINVFRRGELIPADLAAFRAIEVAYDFDDEISKARELLLKAITHTEVRGYAVDNPVTRAPAYVRQQNPKPRKKPTRFRNGSKAAPFVENAPSVIWVSRDGSWTGPVGQRQTTLWTRTIPSKALSCGPAKKPT